MYLVTKPRVAFVGLFHAPRRRFLLQTINADFQALGIHIIRQRLHVWKASVAENVAVRIAEARPSFINNDVLVTLGSHTTRDYGVSHGSNGYSSLCQVAPW